MNMQMVIEETKTLIEKHRYTELDQMIAVFTGVFVDHYNNGIESQPWVPIKTERLAKILVDSSRCGFVRDENGLVEIAQELITITAKLYVNTAMCGHADYGVMEALLEMAEVEDEIGGDFNEFAANYVYDANSGCLRISDYAIGPLISMCEEITRCKTSNQLLSIISRMLNTCHMRSDLSAWYIDGGQDKLRQLSNL